MTVLYKNLNKYIHDSFYFFIKILVHVMYLENDNCMIAGLILIPVTVTVNNGSFRAVVI